MKIFVNNKQNIDTVASNFLEFNNENLDDNIFADTDNKTQEFSGENHSEQCIEALRNSALKEMKITTGSSFQKPIIKQSRAKMTSQERLTNVRENNRRRAKKNRDKKKDQYYHLKDENIILSAENKRLREYISILERRDF
jgi:hypothetical protein